MKKTLFLILGLLITASTVSAASISTLSNIHFTSNDGLQVFPDITINVTAADNINSEDDLSLIIPAGIDAIYEITNSSITFSGSAAAKVKSPVTYSNDGKSLRIDVLEPFAENDELILSNIQLRIYRQGNSAKYLQLDTNNDGTGDFEAANSIRIDETSPKQDQLDPYPVGNAAITISETANHISWTLPIDLDIKRIELTKIDTDEVLDMQLITSYDDVQKGSGYTLTAYDGKNYSTPITVMTSDFVVVPVVEPPVEETLPEEVTTPEEVPSPVQPPLFTDIENHWAHDYVIALYDAGIISGKDTTHFAPDDEISRAELVKIAMNAFAPDSLLTKEEVLPKDSDGGQFKDVSENDWFYNYVYSIYFSNNDIAGYADGTFRPNASITRAEALKILLKVSGTLESSATASTDTFIDVKPGDWFSDYVASAVYSEFVSGYADDTFRPNAYITRAEAAKIAMKIKEKSAAPAQ